MQSEIFYSYEQHNNLTKYHLLTILIANNDP